MQAVGEHLNEIWQEKGYSVARMSIESGVPETTLRRFKNQGTLSLETAVAVARVLHVSLDELTGLMTPPAAAVVKEIEEEIGEELEKKYKPHTEHCATSCPARKAFKEDLNMIRSMYEAAAAKDDALYERGIAVKNDLLVRKDAEIAELKKSYETRIFRFRVTTIVLLAVLLVVLGLFVRFSTNKATALEEDIEDIEETIEETIQ